jgi:hypothetical protein
MYNEEVQEEAVQLMSKNGLRMARVLEVKENVLANAVIGTEEDGDFWYGDLDLNSDVGKLKTVASTLGKSLQVVTDSNRMVIPAN